MLASSLASLARHFCSMPKRSAAAIRLRWPRLRASRTPHSSKASRTPATRNFSSPSAILSAPPQRARSRASPSASSSLPPGNTSAPEKASILWWRTTMKTSSGEAVSPGWDGRTSRTVVAGRGGAGSFLVSFISACIRGEPDCPILAATVPLAACILGPVRSAEKEDAMTATTNSPSDPHSLGDNIRALRAKWGWIVALGIIFMIAGVIALGSVVMATVSAVLGRRHHDDHGGRRRDHRRLQRKRHGARPSSGGCWARSMSPPASSPSSTRSWRQPCSRCSWASP